MASNPRKTQTDGRPYSGTAQSSDPTNEPGQYPVSAQNDIFGGPLPTGTGAPGSAGGASRPSDATNMPGQTDDGLTGISESQITQTGAPGSQGTVPDADAGSDGTSMTYTKASDGIGPYEQVTSSDEITGPQDSTQANDDGYGTGGPQLPGIIGNEPQAGQGRYQPGGGHVMRGGRAVRP